jgi:hypothetical protein
LTGSCRGVEADDSGVSVHAESMPFLTCKAGIVTRIRRRTVRERRGLAGRERWYLRYGDFTAGEEEDPDSFIYRDENGQWTVDKAAAGKVWEDPDRCRRA